MARGSQNFIKLRHDVSFARCAQTTFYKSIKSIFVETLASLLAQLILGHQFVQELTLPKQSEEIG
jgi:hypothetical protein